jgi:hypothetical protein
MPAKDFLDLEEKKNLQKALKGSSVIAMQIINLK